MLTLIMSSENASQQEIIFDLIRKNIEIFFLEKLYIGKI